MCKVFRYVTHYHFFLGRWVCFDSGKVCVECGKFFEWRSKSLRKE